MEYNTVEAAEKAVSVNQGSYSSSFWLCHFIKSDDVHFVGGCSGDHFE